jgi:uncharacterized protein DUF6973
MNILKAFRRLKPIGIWKLLKLCLAHILFVVPTIRATQKCMQISTVHYQRKHYLNSRANAFRHALWNYLIAKYCTKWSKNRDNVLLWTKSITDWHEFAFSNEALAQKMDLHNNGIGRTLFVKNENESVVEVIEILMDKTKESLFINLSTDLKSLPNTLVHIEE